MRSQQDGQVLSYVNDQIRRRYHRKKPGFPGFFVSLIRFRSLFCAPVSRFDPFLTPRAFIGGPKKLCINVIFCNLSTV